MMKKKHGRCQKKKNANGQQACALKYVKQWASVVPMDQVIDDFLPSHQPVFEEHLLFEMHSHSTYSDGILTPTELINRAHGKGVKVLALTDHDTMNGIPEAIEAAHRFNMRVIPGVEISAKFCPRGSTQMVPIHILPYFSCFGPTRIEELEECLANIREGRYLRARNMLLRLKKLKMPVEWEHLVKIAGHGVAPGRLHVARAMVEAGYVVNVKQAFDRYLFDGGPAYATGREPQGEEIVELICKTRGIAVLAHPWALKNPVEVIRSLKAAGLHGLEVYRSDGKLAEYHDLADAYGLVKLGGSDYHGTRGKDESDLGSVNLTILTIHDFLSLARPVWCTAMQEILTNFVEEPSDAKLERIINFGSNWHVKVDQSGARDILAHLPSSWLADGRQDFELEEALHVKFLEIMISSKTSVSLEAI